MTVSSSELSAINIFKARIKEELGPIKMPYYKCNDEIYYSESLLKRVTFIVLSSFMKEFVNNF
jgi:hypothetical protein